MFSRITLRNGDVAMTCNFSKKKTHRYTTASTLPRGEVLQRRRTAMANFAGFDKRDSYASTQVRFQRAGSGQACAARTAGKGRAPALFAVLLVLLILGRVSRNGHGRRDRRRNRRRLLLSHGSDFLLVDGQLLRTRGERGTVATAGHGRRMGAGVVGARVAQRLDEVLVLVATPTKDSHLRPQNREKDKKIGLKTVLE